MDRSNLVGVARRACTLDELIETALRGVGGRRRPPTESAEFLERWTTAYARGDRDAFLRRLEWDGLTENAVLWALSVIRKPGTAELPEWILPLVDVLPSFSLEGLTWESVDGTTRIAPFEPGDGRAFGELWRPFLLWARQRLLEMAPEAGNLIEPRALGDLERHLVDQLVWTSELAVYERFQRYSAESGSREPDAGGRVLYGEFLESMFSGGLAALFEEFSGLARQVCRILDTWLETAVELLDRLAADRIQIENSFGGGRPPGPVSRVRTDLSDPHHGGRRVLGLAFRSGLRLIYKPRSIQLEATYNRFLEWLAVTGLDSTPPPIRSLPGDGYGWVEHVSNQPVSTAEEVAAYYRRAGSLLCITHVLNASDLHLENLIARPGGPILVDLETILQPQYGSRGPGHESGDEPEAPGLESPVSFLDTGLLTALQVDLDGRVQDIGGLAGGAPPTKLARRWSSVNTAAMQPFWERVPVPRHNLVRLAEHPQPPAAFAEHITEGFVAAYRFLKDHRDAIRAENGPLSWFRGLRTRVVFRPSDLYAKVLYHLGTPTYQRSGLGQGLLIDSLNRGFNGERSRPGVWPLVAEERRAMQGLDVPHFTVPTDRSELRSPDDEPLAGLFGATGLEIVEERLRRLDESDLEWQLRVLKRALSVPEVDTARPLGGVSGTPGWVGDARDPAAPNGVGDGGALLVRAAASIAAEIRNEAVEGVDGSLAWTRGEPATGDDPDALDRFSLYGGDVGVSLFFAALARITGREVYHQTARAALRPIAAAIDGEPSPDTPRAIGACDGLGGIVYALTWISVLLDDRDVIRLALSAARRIDESSIAADATFDVAGGAAGAILGLLALFPQTAASWLVERAARCGDHLISTASATPGGGSGWTTSDGLMLAGFAHGAAGIGTALARLSEVTGRDVYREMATKAFLYERTLFDEESMNWPLLLRPESDGAPDRIFMTTWCHGAPGGVLARIGALGAIDDPDIRAEIDAALEAVERFGDGALDHLCCGNMGRVEAFLTAGRILGKVEHIRAATMRAVMVLQRSLSTGAFRLYLHGTEGPATAPGFFRGVSGIGYQLLRVARPDEIPSVLMFQPPCGAGAVGDPECA